MQTLHCSKANTGRPHKNRLRQLRFRLCAAFGAPFCGNNRKSTSFAAPACRAFSAPSFWQRIFLPLRTFSVPDLSPCRRSIQGRLCRGLRHYPDDYWRVQRPRGRDFAPKKEQGGHLQRSQKHACASFGALGDGNISLSFQSRRLRRVLFAREAGSRVATSSKVLFLVDENADK